MNRIEKLCRNCTFWDRTRVSGPKSRPCKLRSRKRRDMGMSNCTVDTTAHDSCSDFRPRPVMA